MLSLTHAQNWLFLLYAFFLFKRFNQFWYLKFNFNFLGLLQKLPGIARSVYSSCILINHFYILLTTIELQVIVSCQNVCLRYFLYETLYHIVPEA